MSNGPVRRCQRGAALLLVLWLIVLLIALTGAFAFSARIEQVQGRVLYQGVVGDQAARAGLEYAVQRLGDADPATRWIGDGRSYAWNFNGVPVQVRIADERGKVDLNVADQALLASLMTVLGADPAQAGQLAGAIADWRDPDSLGQPVGAAEDPQYAAAGLPYGAKDAPFEGVSELELVLGMPQELAARMARHVTVHADRALPDERFADSVVLQALGVDPEPVLAGREEDDGRVPAFGGGGSGTYSIDSRARLADGRQTRLRAVVRVGGGSLPGAAYVPLQWKEGASADDDD